MENDVFKRILAILEHNYTHNSLSWSEENHMQASHDIDDLMAFYEQSKVLELVSELNDSRAWTEVFYILSKYPLNVCLDVIKTQMKMVEEEA